MDLEPEQLRVIGSLVEKQLTTPQQYPLTLNALVAACNQTSNRNPVVAYDEATVVSVVAALKDRHLLRFVHPSHGRSATRYRQVLDEVLDLDVPALALLGVLALRGPQTPGELRVRTERMAEFSTVAQVETELEALGARAEPLVRRLPRGLGHKESRYQHLLGPCVEPAAAPGPPPTSPSAPVATTAVATTPVAQLAAEVAALRAEVAELRRDLDELRGRRL